VKANGDLSSARLKGAIAPEEFLQWGNTAEFKEIDPREGFSVRNFQIQAAKTAMVSDIVVYGEDEDEDEVHRLGASIAAAQAAWRDNHKTSNHDIPVYNTFVCTTPFAEFEAHHPEIVAVDSAGFSTGNVMDFFHQERLEMATMTKASEIARNVWLGPTPDPIFSPNDDDEDAPSFDIFIECSDLGRLNPKALKAIAEATEKGEDPKSYLEFPSSGSIMPPSWSLAEADDIVESCRWIYNVANGIRPTEETVDLTSDHEGDSPMPSPSMVTSRPRRVLIHCTDGYTESSMLALAYYTYSHGVSVSDAWLEMHTEKGRNFFAYPSDVALLTAIAPSLLADSPALSEKSSEDVSSLVQSEPAWLGLMDGSLPSRVLDYMYLGNLGHANNPDLLRSLGIGQILSVGEKATWKEEETEKWGEDKVCVVQSVQDNGVDPLTEEFERCLAFIGMLSFRILLRSVYPSISPAILIDAIILISHRQRPSRRYCNARALPRGRLSVRHNMHSRSDALSAPLLSARLLFRACPPPQCHHSTTSKIQL
jgi:dual specificity MAP kinase phosphatase